MNVKINYKLTPDAEKHLDDIYDYGLENWGETKAELYLRELESSFIWLGQNPELGRIRADIREEYRSWMQGSHVIFYRITSDYIEIIAVFHERCDVVKQF